MFLGARLRESTCVERLSGLRKTSGLSPLRRASIPPSLRLRPCSALHLHSAFGSASAPSTTLGLHFKKGREGTAPSQQVTRTVSRIRSQRAAVLSKTSLQDLPTSPQRISALRALCGTSNAVCKNRSLCFFRHRREERILKAGARSV